MCKGTSRDIQRPDLRPFLSSRVAEPFIALKARPIFCLTPETAPRLTPSSTLPQALTHPKLDLTPRTYPLKLTPSSTPQTYPELKEVLEVQELILQLRDLVAQNLGWVGG